MSPASIWTINDWNFFFLNKFQLWAPFVKFLLNFGKDDSINDIQRVISELRECLDWKSLECSTEDKNTNKLTIFNCIYNTLKGSKKIFEAWTKAILGISTSCEQNSMDLLILIIMMSINDEKCNFLELNIRRRISSGCFNIKLLEEMSTDFSIILSKYSKYLLEMIDVFFRDKSFVISNFAYTGYRWVLVLLKRFLENLIHYFFFLD